MSGPASPGDGLIVLVHGYLDGPAAWGALIGRLSVPGWRVVAAGLEAAGLSDGAEGEVLDRYAAQVLGLVDREATDADAPVILIGHSMGGQVAELAGPRLGARLRGLVLVTSAPLAGHPLAPEVMERFASRAGATDLAAIRDGKRALGVSLDDAALDILAACTAATSRETALEQLAAWSGGHPQGREASAVRAPVLIVTTDDRFFAETLLRREGARFPDVRFEAVRDAGHWPHLERPAELAAALGRFAAQQRRDRPTGSG